MEMLKDAVRLMTALNSTILRYNKTSLVISRNTLMLKFSDFNQFPLAFNASEAAFLLHLIA